MTMSRSKYLQMENRICLEKQDLSDDQVQELILDHCYAPRIGGLTNQFVNLEALSMIKVGLTSLEGFPILPKLRKLDLCNNELTGGLELLRGSKNLQELDISGNHIKELDAIKSLQQFNNLTSLYLYDCDIAATNNYRQKVFGLLPNLHTIDGMTQETEQYEPDAKRPALESATTIQSAESQPVSAEVAEENKQPEAETIYQALETTSAIPENVLPEHTIEPPVQIAETITMVEQSATTIQSAESQPVSAEVAEENKQPEAETIYQALETTSVIPENVLPEHTIEPPVQIAETVPMLEQSINEEVQSIDESISENEDERVEGASYCVIEEEEEYSDEEEDEEKQVEQSDHRRVQEDISIQEIDSSEDIEGQEDTSFEDEELSEGEVVSGEESGMSGEESDMSGEGEEQITQLYNASPSSPTE